MQTDSDASRTYLVSASASECSATVRMPNSPQALRIRSAISPRFAITSLSIIGKASAAVFLNDKQRFPILHRITAAFQNLFDDSACFGVYLIEDLHRFNHA